MKSVRIEPEGNALLVDVVCDCDRNNLFNEETHEASVRHRVTLGSGSVVRVCCSDCGRRYVIIAQRTHVHINDIPPLP